MIGMTNVIVKPNNKIISFTIEDSLYQAEAGMTWGDWVISEYNTGLYYIDENDNRLTIRSLTNLTYSYYRDNYIWQYAVDFIINNENYLLYVE